MTITRCFVLLLILIIMLLVVLVMLALKIDTMEKLLNAKFDNIKAKQKKLEAQHDNKTANDWWNKN